MAISTKAQLAGAIVASQQILISKLTNPGAVGATFWGSWFGQAGVYTPAGVMAGTSTTAGVVPDVTTQGCPSILPFGAGHTGYLGRVRLIPAGTAVNAGRYRLCDMLFKAGAYSFNSAVTLSAQPSYSARMPNSDYKGTEIWVEAVTAFTGLLSVVVTYTNQDGVAGRSTGTVSIPTAMTANRMVQLPLQSGDTGVQKIESVTGTVATVGTFNVLVLRPLWCGRTTNSYYIMHGPDMTDLPILFATSALIWQGVGNDAGTSAPVFDGTLDIIEG